MKGVIEDKLGGGIGDLRIWVSDGCNLRCDYCMGKEMFGDDQSFLGKNELVSFEELRGI